VPLPAQAQKEIPAGDGKMIWEWPAQGRLLYTFGQGANQKGVGIEGHTGQPVLAAAPGKVVYSGSGLRGYGKLIIIKHNASYLSVYAHNSQLLVKEGQSVAKGQKIAEIGDTDGDRVALHFEIRRLGKPIDPLQYLPERNS
jgi:lipoprotein NlpD